MLGLKYFKAEPTEFARMRVKGKLKKEGEGISGFYLPFRTTIEMVSVGVNDQPFAFQEVSQDNQEVALQGGFVYRISDPKVAMRVYNFSIDPHTKQYQSDDGSKLPAHVLQLVRGETRKLIQGANLEGILRMGDELSEKITQALSKRDLRAVSGVEFRTLYFESIRPKPEIAKALEATYRESLLQKADEAVYGRRALAVEKERTIQQNEMRTRIELEERRKSLVELEGANTLSLAGFKAEAIQKEMAAYNGIEANKIVAQALLSMGQNAAKIGNLTITPDLLAGIMNQVKVASK